MIRLFWINHHARVPGESGGTRHYELGRRLTRDHGFEVTIIRGSNDHMGPIADNLVSDEAREKGFSLSCHSGCKFLTVGCSPCQRTSRLSRIRNMSSFARNTANILKSGAAERPDIVIGSVVHTFGASAAYDIARHFRVPFVYEVRDLWPLTPIEIGGYSKWHPFILYLDYLDRRLAKGANLIVTTAPLMKEYYMERFGIPEERFLWVTNGTDLELFKPARPERIQDKTTFDLYYTGSLGLANGLDAIFDQLPVIKARFPHFRLVLVGDGPMQEHLQKRAEIEKLPVIFINTVPKTDLPDILENADACLVYLMPSKIYRYGISLNKLADYFAAGKPVLFVGDCAENPVLRSGAGVVAKNIDEFPEALDKMILWEPEERERIGQKGRLFAMEHYAWNKLAEKLAKALQNLTCSRPSNE